jgi:hypothetical protein
MLLAFAVNMPIDKIILWLHPVFTHTVSMCSSESHNSHGLAQSTLSLGSAGTRRTVYYTGEDNTATGDTAQESYVS